MGLVNTNPIFLFLTIVYLTPTILNQTLCGNDFAKCRIWN